jgi:PRTRC genetic system protein E
MLIDFKVLSKLIPETGSLSLSIKKGKGEKLDVLFRVKHDLAIMKNTAARTSEEGKQIEAATKLLDQPYAFSATAEELNTSFEEKILQPVESTRSLVDLITDRTKALDEAARSIRTSAARTKPSDKPKATGTGEASQKTVEKTPKEEPLIGSLFGSVGAEAEKTGAGEKAEDRSGDEKASVTGSVAQQQSKSADETEGEIAVKNVDDNTEEGKEAA